MSELKRTPLYGEYEKFGAKTIDFGGWELPVQFTGIIHEHELTRTRVAMFDVSHMGEIKVTGKDSLPFLQRLVTNDVAKLVPNRAQYSFMLNENGGTIDDFLIYMLAEDDYLLVVNAENRKKDYEWLLQHKRKDEHVEITDVSDSYGLIAVQGPKAVDVIAAMTDTDINGLRPFSFLQDVKLSDVDVPVMLSRTGYTGEDGFEIYIEADQTPELWRALLKHGEPFGLEPAGLGARDTLRFEAGLPLYGQELSEDISPLEAGLDFAVKLNKEEDFIGKKALLKQKEAGVKRKLVGIEMIDKGIPRTGYPVLNEKDEEIGFVTTGTKSPTLNKHIGFALVNTAYGEIGTELFVQVRNKKLKAKVIETPFYKREA